MKSITGDRIKIALYARNMKASELAKVTKISKSMISEYIHGKYIPKQKNLYLIASALRVNESWLMGLDVPMEKEEVNLAQNSSIQKKWFEAISLECNIPIEFIKKQFLSSMYSNDVPINYKGFRDFILLEYQHSEIDPIIKEIILNEESRYINDQISESDSKIHSIYFMMNEFMNEDDIDKLYKLIELTFPDVVSEYKNKYITLNNIEEKKN